VALCPDLSPCPGENLAVAAGKIRREALDKPGAGSEGTQTALERVAKLNDGEAGTSG